MVSHVKQQIQSVLEQFPEDTQLELLQGVLKNLLNTEVPVRLEPVVAKTTRGRPSLTNRRLPSKFENVEKGMKRKSKGKGKRPKKRAKVSGIVLGFWGFSNVLVC